LTLNDLLVISQQILHVVDALDFLVLHLIVHQFIYLQGLLELLQVLAQPIHRFLRVFFGKVERLGFHSLEFEGVTVQCGLEALPLLDDVSLDFEEFMQLFVDILEAVFEMLVFLGDAPVFFLEIVDEELVKFVFTVGEDQAGAVVLDFLNDFEPVLDLVLIHFGGSSVLDLFLQLCDGLLVLSHFVFVLVFLVGDLE
jgi:hypothetical protein